MRIVALASGLAIGIPVLALAATQSVTEQASYALGDSDTRAQGRDLCLAKLERKALEASGSLVESEMEMISTEKGGGGVNDSARQHLRSYVGAVVTASGVTDVFHLDGEHIVVDCTATITFDPDDVRDRLRAARADTTTKAEVDQQQARIAALEAQVQSLSLKLATQAQAQALTQAQQSQALAQAQMQAYAQAQALAQMQRQAQGAAAPPRAAGGDLPPAYSYSPAGPAPGSSPGASLRSLQVPQAAPPALGEPPPPVPQPRFQVQVAPLTGPSAQAPLTNTAQAPLTNTAQAPSPRPPIQWTQAAPPPAAAAAPPGAQLASLGNNPRARVIRAGMSAPDLLRVIGRPRASIHEYFQVYSWDYGDIWVTINAGMVQCVSVRQNPMCRWMLAYR